MILLCKTLKGNRLSLLSYQGQNNHPNQEVLKSFFLQALTAEGSAVLVNFSGPYALLSREVGRGGGHSWEVGVEVYRRSLQNLTLLKTKIAPFAILFKTRDLIICVLMYSFCSAYA